MSYSNEPNKIDRKPVSGLLGVNNSLAYKVHEIEKHFHNWERWFGAAVTPNAEIKAADMLTTTTAPFIINAGNNDWGAWVLILGSGDTPTNIGGTFTKYDMHNLQVVANQRANPYFVQIGFGTSVAQALTDGTYTAKVLAFDGSNAETAFEIMMNRVNSGTKAWARCKCPGQNGATLSFYYGIHEYVG